MTGAVLPTRRVSVRFVQQDRAADVVPSFEIVGARVTVFGAHSGRTVDLGDAVWLTAAEQSVVELRPIPADSGIGVGLTSVLSTLTRGDATRSSVGDRLCIAIIVRGLVSAAAAERVDDESFVIPSRQQAVVRAMQIISARRDDPALNGPSIARQLGISVRTLQAAFRDSSTTVAASLRAIRREYETLSSRMTRPPRSRAQAA